MRTLRALIGMPVVCGRRRIGRALRGQLSEDMLALQGIWISAGIRGTRFVPAERLELLGRVFVMAEDSGRRGRMGRDPLPARAVSTDGRRLGAVTGAGIDEVTFAVTALELSAGLWDDLARRRQWVARYTVNRETGEVIIDPAEEEREEEAYEEWTDEGTVHRHADRRIGGHDLRRHELADGEEMESGRQEDGQLDL